MSDGTSYQSPLCSSCGWPIARHVTPCPLELPLGNGKPREVSPAVVSAGVYADVQRIRGRELTTGEPWPRA